MKRKQTAADHHNNSTKRNNTHAFVQRRSHVRPSSKHPPALSPPDERHSLSSPPWRSGGTRKAQRRRRGRLGTSSRVPSYNDHSIPDMNRLSSTHLISLRVASQQRHFIFYAVEFRRHAQMSHPTVEKEGKGRGRERAVTRTWSCHVWRLWRLGRPSAAINLEMVESVIKPCHHPREREIAPTPSPCRQAKECRGRHHHVVHRGFGFKHLPCRWLVRAGV